MEKIHIHNPEEAEEAASGFRGTTTIKTVEVDSCNCCSPEVKDNCSCEDCHSNNTDTKKYEPKEFDLSKPFTVVKAPEQKISNGGKGKLYFNCLLEQDGNYLSLPAKGLIGKCLVELFFNKEFASLKEEGSNKYSIRLYYSYKVSYYSKENRTNKTLGIADIKGVNADGENAIEKAFREIEEYQKSKEKK